MNNEEKFEKDIRDEIAKSGCSYSTAFRTVLRRGATRYDDDDREYSRVHDYIMNAQPRLTPKAAHIVTETFLQNAKRGATVLRELRFENEKQFMSEFQQAMGE